MLFALLLSVSVIDGDTIRIDGESYRLHGVDTPELRRAQCEQERRFAYEAKGFVSGYLSGRAVKVTKDYGKDRYGRSVVDLDVDGIDLGRTLLKEGYAQVWDHDGGAAKPDWCGGG